MTRILLLSTALLFSALVSSAPACKCVMPGPTVSEEYTRSDFIFIGRAIQGDLVSEIHPEVKEYPKLKFTFEPKKVFKGPASQENFYVQTGLGFGDCGYPFRLGVLYLVYGSISEGTLETGICTRTIPIGFFQHKTDAHAKDELNQLQEINEGITRQSSGSH